MASMFIELDAMTLDVHEGVGGPEVDGHVRGQQAEKATDHMLLPLWKALGALTCPGAQV